MRLLAPLFLFILAIFPASVCAQKIAVVMSSDAAPYQEALEGFREVVRHRITSVQIHQKDPSGWSQQVKRLRSVIEPDLVFVIGTSALQAVATEITNVPIVHAMAFNPFAGKDIENKKNITGISMIPGVNQSISLLQELNPKYRRIGVIYDPIRTSPLFIQARTLGHKENLQLVAREIRSAADIGGALKSLENEIDVLWLWPDDLYLGADILQRIFLFSFERKVPILGLSERHTQMGAVLSLSYANARDMGRQAGESANKLLLDPGSIQPPAIAARQTTLTVNLKTARKLGVNVPESIIRRADNAVKAPIYQDGDWWVFRINTLYPDGRSEIEDHRVTFKNGKFESEHSSFLTGGDLAGTPSFLPFASVFVDDPTKKWLDFPLLPGRLWQFSYPSASYIGGRNRRTLAVAEVIGKTEKPIATAAGTFEAIEISRHDQLNPAAFSTYFYSPQTKSVVKLKAEIDATDRRSSGRRFELELIGYGSERHGPR